MTCEEFIKKDLCLGCTLAELNENADYCIYRDEPEEQMEMEGLDE